MAVQSSEICNCSNNGSLLLPGISLKWGSSPPSRDTGASAPSMWRFHRLHHATSSCCTHLHPTGSRRRSMRRGGFMGQTWENHTSLSASFLWLELSDLVSASQGRLGNGVQLCVQEKKKMGFVEPGSPRHSLNQQAGM